MLTHRHTAEMELALTARRRRRRRRCCSRRTSCRWCAGIHATCHARPAVDGLSARRRCSRPTASSTRASRSCAWSTTRRRRRRRPAATAACVTVRFDERTGSVLAIGVLDNLVKGASGQAIQNANLAARPPRDRRPAARSGCGHDAAVSITAARASRPAGSRAGSSRTAQPDLAIVTTADRAPVPAAGVFTHEPRARGAGAGQPRAPARTGAPRRSCSAPATPTRRRASRVAPTRRAWPQLTADGSRRRGRRRARVLHRADRLLMPMDALESGIPKLARGRSNGGDAAADAILTTDTVPKEAVATVGGRHDGGRRRHGEGRGDARRRRWRRCSRSSPPTPRSTPRPLQRGAARARSTQSFNQLCVDACTSTNDTVLVLANGASGVAIATSAAASARSPTRSPRCAASLAEQMARDAEGATKFARVTVAAPDRRRGPARGRVPSPTSSWSSAR